MLLHKLNFTPSFCLHFWLYVVAKMALAVLYSVLLALELRQKLKWFACNYQQMLENFGFSISRNKNKKYK